MNDFLDILAKSARETVSQRYYEGQAKATVSSASLKESILRCNRAPIIAEIKAASPSSGILREKLEPEQRTESYTKGGAVGISVLTEPKHFKGSLETLARTRRFSKLPILMKDIIVNLQQLAAASTLGANAVLLIQALFDRGYCEHDAQEMIAKAHESKLEVLLEVHNEKELQHALDSEADLIGINNRDLSTLEVDLSVTRKLLERSDHGARIFVSESGIRSPADIRFLRSCGARAFLVGSAVMMSTDAEQKVKELVEAL